MEKLKELHGLLYSEGLEKDDFATFQKKFAAPDRQAELHKFVQDEYGEKKDLATWKSEFFSEKKNDTPQVSSPASGVGGKTVLADTPSSQAPISGQVVPSELKPGSGVLQPGQEMPAIQPGSEQPAPFSMTEGVTEMVPFDSAKAVYGESDIKQPIDITDHSGGQGTANPALTVSDPNADLRGQDMFTASERKKQRRSEAIADVSLKLTKLAEDTGKDYRPWKMEIDKILNDPNGGSQEARDAKALRKVYDIYKNQGVERSSAMNFPAIANIAIPATIPIEQATIAEQPYAMKEVWNHLADAEEQWRMEDPKGWEQDIEARKVKHYDRLAGPDPKYVTKGDVGADAADKQVIMSALDNGTIDLGSVTNANGTEFSLNAEAKMRTEVLNMDRKINEVKFKAEQGIDAQIKALLAKGDKAGAQALVDDSDNIVAEAMKASGMDVMARDRERLTAEAMKFKSARKEKLIADRAAIAKQLDRTDLPEIQVKAGQAVLRQLDQEIQGFLDPRYKFAEVAGQNKEEIEKAAKPGDTPFQAMQRYLGNLIFEEKLLSERIGGGLEGEESALDNIQRNVTGVTIRSWNADEERLKAIRGKIKSIAPVVLLNEKPEEYGDGVGGFGEAVKNLVVGNPLKTMNYTGEALMNIGKGAANTLWGASDWSQAVGIDANSTASRALDVSEMLQSVGADEQKIVNPIYKERYAETKETGLNTWLSTEHMTDLSGMILAMGMQARVGGAVMKGLGVPKVLGQLTAQVAAGTKGAKFAHAALTAFSKGASYEITGRAFKSQQHFFNFTTGLVGGATEGAVLGGISAASKYGIGVGRKMLSRVAMTFGDKTAAAEDWIIRWGERLAKEPVTEASKWTFGPNGRSLQEMLDAPGRLTHGLGSVVGQVGEGSIRTLQHEGGSSDIIGTVNGLVNTFRGSNVHDTYWEGLKKQFGNTWSERAAFFMDMMFIGMGTGGGHKAGLGAEIQAHLEELNSQLTAEERAPVDAAVESLSELDQMHDDLLKGEGREMERAKSEAPPAEAEMAPPAEIADARTPEEMIAEGKPVPETVAAPEIATPEPVLPAEVEAPLTDAEKVKQMQTLADRINAGEDPKVVLNGMADNYAEAVKDIAKQRKKGGTSQAAPLPEAPPVTQAPENVANPVTPSPHLRDQTIDINELSAWAQSSDNPESGSQKTGDGSRFQKALFGTWIDKQGNIYSALKQDGMEPGKYPFADKGKFDSKGRFNPEDTVYLSPDEVFQFNEADYLNHRKQKAKEAPVEAKPQEPVVVPTIAPVTPPPVDVAPTVIEPPTPPVDASTQGGGTPPPTLPPTVEAVSGPPESTPPGKGTHGIWDTFVKHGAKASDSLWATLGKVDKYYDKTTHKEQYQAAMRYLGGWKPKMVKGQDGKMVEEGGSYTEDPLLKVAELGREGKHDIADFEKVLTRRLVMTDILGNVADQIANELKAETDPDKQADIRDHLQQLSELQADITKALMEQGTIGGQGTGFIGFWRNMYTHADGQLAAAINKHNMARAKSQGGKARAEQFANDLAKIREKTGQQVAEQVSKSDPAKGKSPDKSKATPEEKAASKKSQEFIAKERAKRSESLDRLKNLNADFNKRMGGSLTSGGILLKYTVLPVEAAIEVTKIGISLAKEGAVRFADWAPKVKDYLKGVVDVTDEDLKKIFEEKDDKGNSAKSISEDALDKASVAPKAVAAKAESLRTQIQRAFKEGGDIKQALMDDVKLTSEESDFVMKRGESVIDGTAKELAKQQKEAKEKTIEQKERDQRKAAEAMAEKVAKSRRIELEQKVATAMDNSIKADGGKDLRKSLTDEGFSDSEADDIIKEKGTEFGKRASEALQKAGKASTPAKPGEPSLRKKVQDAFNAHFDIKNPGDRSLKDRLVQDAGLSDSQADTVLNAEQAQVAERTKAMNDKIDRMLAKQVINQHFSPSNTEKISLRDRIMRDAGLDQATADTIVKENARDIALKEKQVSDKIAEMVRINEEQQKVADFKEREKNVRDAINDHFGQNTMAKAVAAEMGIDATTDPKEKEAIMDKAKLAAKFGKMKLINGRAMTRALMIENLTKPEVGFDPAEAEAIADLMIAERAKTLFDRVKEKTGLDDNSVQAIVDASKAEFDTRARAQVEARANKTRSRKQRVQVHRPTTDVDRALETLHDSEFDNDTINDIFKERLGFVRELTPAEVTQAKGLSKALANSSPGSILELDAARNLDRFFDTFIPREGAWREVGDMWTSLMYAGMLSGFATSIKNILSAATIISMSPLTNIGNMSEWVNTMRTSVKAGMAAEKGKGIGAAFKAAGRANPVTGAIVKYGAVAKGAKQGWMYARDIMANGWIDNKFIEGGSGKLGRQMTVTERRYYDPFKERLKAKGLAKAGLEWVPWVSKYAGRNLQAQDVFLRTIAYEMQLAEAVRRVNIGTERAVMEKNGYDGISYAKWVRYEMGMDNPKVAKARAKAIEEVDAHEANLQFKAKPKVKARFVALRTRELIHEALPGLKKGDFEAAEAIARSQIFTHPRGGLNGQFARLLNKVKGKALSRALLAPLIPFTTIVGNLADTAWDYAPGVGAASANGFSASELTKYMWGRKSTQGNWGDPENLKSNSQRMSRLAAKYDPKKSWLENRLAAMASQLKDGHGDPLYYEQMGRAHFGLQAMVGMLAATGPGSPLQVSWDDDRTSDPKKDRNDTGREYTVSWDGVPLFRFPDYPAIAAPLAFVGAWHSYAKQHPEDHEGLAARAFYAFGEMMTVSAKMSVAESAIGAMDLISGVLEGLRTGVGGEDFAAGLYKNTIDKYLKSVSKGLPQRWSIFEQFGGIFDQQKYDKKGIANSLKYYGAGVFYKGKPTLDIFGDPIKHSPFDGVPLAGLAKSMLGLDDYINDVAQRPHVKFLDDRGITFGPPANGKIAWDDPEGILGVEFRDYDAEQYYFYASQIGPLFKKKLYDIMETTGKTTPDGEVIPAVDAEGNEYTSAAKKIADWDKEIVAPDGTYITKTEAMVRKAMADARKEAREIVFKKYNVLSIGTPESSFEQ